MTILIAWLMDAFLGEPPARVHPVIWMGSYLSAARRLNNRTIAQGAALWLGGASLVVGSASGLQSLARKLPFPLNALVLALLLKPLFAWRGLKQAGESVRNASDLPSARQQLSWNLVSRDTSELSAGEVYGATIESVAENLSDSLVAPLFYFLIGGLPATALYRYANTADAMWGYRTEELEQFGKFAARTDDVLNWIPSRLTAYLLIGAAYIQGLDAPRAIAIHRRDAHNTTSPNAGQPMSAMAGILGRQLTKRGVYSLGAEFPEPTRADIDRALRVSQLAAWGFVAISVLVSFGRRK